MTSILSRSGREIYSGKEKSLSAAISNAIKNGISLHGASLREADLHDTDLHDTDLRDADLSYADLSEANLNCANLRGAKLIGANLSGADLRDTDLRDTDLSDADLSGADLRFVSFTEVYLGSSILDGADFRFSTGLHIPEIAKSMELHYTIVLVGDSLFIGCRHHKLHEWFSFSDETINKMGSGALKWWRENKAMLYTWSEAAKFGIELTK
jgi:uncharacterized protein YjbI with pentapeptide repeats